VVRVSDRVPNLRVVIDHLPQMQRPTEAAAQASYDASMKAFRTGRKSMSKCRSAAPAGRRQDPVDLAFYRPRLDEILDVFGIDRVLYGSDWRTAINGCRFRLDSRSSRSTSWQGEGGGREILLAKLDQSL